MSLYTERLEVWKDYQRYYQSKHDQDMAKMCQVEIDKINRYHWDWYIKVFSNP